MTEIILSQWVIASALGAICLALLFFCLVPAMVMGRRMRRMSGSVAAVHEESARLREVLERLSDKQIEASARQQEQLGLQLTSSLREPLESVVESLQSYGKQHKEHVAQGLKEQMTVFADRLDQLLGGQVAQAKDLQTKTLKSLEITIAAFQDMATSLGVTTQGATQAMVKELRAGISRSLAETDSSISDLIRKLSAEVTSAVAALEQQAEATGRLAVEHQQKISEEAERSMEILSAEVRAQTQAVEQAAQSMRTIGTDVGQAVDRIIQGMTGLISGAAKEIMKSGEGFADIFDKSSELSRDLTETAAALAASSKDIGVVVSDYRDARETLQTMVDVMRTAAESARRDSSSNSEVVARMEASVQKLIAAQGKADEHLAKLNGVLSEVHTSFNKQMLKAVREFQEHLTRTATGQVTPEESQRRHTEFDRMISDWIQGAPGPKEAKPAPREEKPAARMPAMLGGLKK